MKTVVAAALAMALIVAEAGAASARDADPGMVVAASFPLARRHHGADGAVVLLADRRVTAATIKPLQDFQWFGFGAAPDVAPPVTQHPLRDALLRLTDGSGGALATVELGTPFASLRTATLLPDKGKHFVIETANGGFGQFTGTLARLFTVEDGGLRFLSAEDGPGAPRREIHLRKAAGADWLILPATGGRPGEILQASCRPGEGTRAGFAQILESWRLEEDGWRRRVAISLGYCAWVPGLPPLSAFP